MLPTPREDTSEEAFDLHARAYLVTGGTGSFGKRFVKYLLDTFSPKRVIVFSRDELKQSEMAEALNHTAYPAVRYFLGDVRDRDRLEMALRGVDVVVHAAALKQVPAAEYNPFECVHTNVLGAENVVRASIRAGVKRVLALSTDKAVNPINLYGASKLAADKIFVAANNLSGEGGPKFSVVRYGNVLGSRGSVVPYYQKLIREKAASLPVTDARMTRFWITLGQAIRFVVNAIEQMRGGEIFVPKIPSMSVLDVARALAPGLPQTIVGIRPGEKLHEALITEDDARQTVDIGEGYVITPSIRFANFGNYSEAPKVPVGFEYTSDKNPDMLSTAKFLQLLEEEE